MQKFVVILSLGIMVAGLLYIGQEKHNTQHSRLDVDHINIQVKIQRLEKKLFSLRDKKGIRAFLQENQLFATQFLGMSSSSTKEALIERLYSMIRDPHMHTLHQETQRIFGDLSTIQEQFKTAFQHLKHYYPDFKVPQIATFITGMGTDLYLSKDLIVIGLDFFMGEGAKFRPIAMPDYLLKGYQPAHIVPKISLLLSQQFIQIDNNDATLLADMLHYGKAYYFAQALLPQVEASALLDYTPVQLADVERHQATVWEHFIERELLYTTNHLTKNKYLSNRPFVVEIGPRCPGHVGRWLGWEIVKKYMQRHANVSMPALMKNANSQTLFTQSKYRPKK